MTTPNRLEFNWNRIKPLLIRRWDRLTESDLDYIDGEFDRIVEIVKQRYNEPIKRIQEENIRYEVLQILKRVEQE